LVGFVTLLTGINIQQVCSILTDVTYCNFMNKLLWDYPSYLGKEADQGRETFLVIDRKEVVAAIHGCC